MGQIKLSKRQRWGLVLTLAVIATGCGTSGGPADGGTAAGGGGGGGAISCPTGMFLCSGACSDPKTDSQNCGACGINCGVGRSCIDAVCTRNCTGNEAACGEVCVNVKTDVSNCGSCGAACVAGQSCQDGGCVCTGAANLLCDGVCYNPLNDVSHCGSCTNSCDGGYACLNGACDRVCTSPETRCGTDVCTILATDPQNCGACGRLCPSGASCACSSGRSLCGSSPNWACIDTLSDSNNCGGCGLACPAGQTCASGACELPCPAGTTRCNGACVNTSLDSFACGSCFNSCTGSQYCDGGSCAACDSNTTDCDRDGWKVSEGDCCDTPGGCGGQNPKLVNPGAFDIVGNAFDDNCNGLIDTADTLDTQPCDSSLPSNTVDAGAYAAALGICRTTSENPATPQQRTWGLISAQILRADGTAIPEPDAVSIRANFGNVYVPQEGQRFAIISSGIAADATQTLPGPNGGPSSTQSNTHDLNGDTVNISSCTNPLCIKDWFQTANPPLKAANKLPEAPNCSVSGALLYEANDSVMLVLRLRAPTNARAFSFKGLFLSTEYPEYVCDQFNDQLIALVKTPGGAPAPIPNPVDFNLMTYVGSTGGKWPIGINVAKGTDLFKACEAPGTNPDCSDSEVSTTSCSEGLAPLAGTGFESPGAGFCAEGGATRWLESSGNVVPGQIVELRIAIWDVGDDILDSTAILDGFKWQTTARTAGTD